MMTETTYDPLSASMQMLLDKGDDVTIYDWHNAIFGSVPWDVDALVPRGLWKRKRRHEADNQMQRFTVYGPV